MLVVLCEARIQFCQGLLAVSVIVVLRDHRALKTWTNFIQCLLQADCLPITPTPPALPNTPNDADNTKRSHFTVYEKPDKATERDAIFRHIRTLSQRLPGTIALGPEVTKFRFFAQCADAIPALLYAGARSVDSVLGCMWPIQSRAGRVCTEALYADVASTQYPRVVSPGGRPSVDLARAVGGSVAKMRRGELGAEFKQAYFWAPFAVYGLWYFPG
ncbi:hypothetical protein V8F06_010367 [Rhypophila decipiens]